MTLVRNMLVTGCCLAALWGCAREPEKEEAANLTEELTEILPDQPADPAIVNAAPALATTVFANEWVGVADVKLDDGEVVPAHQAGVRYVYPLSPCTISVVRNDDEEVLHLVPGELTTLAAGRISLANVGESGGEFLVVERNSIETSPELETLAVPDDAVEEERHGTVLLDDDNVMVVDITLDALQGDPLPPNLPTLVIALSDCDLEMRGAAVSDDEHIQKAGEAFWETAGYNVVGNVGDGPAHILVLAFRR